MTVSRIVSFAVVVPLYNKRDTIGRSISSVIRQNRRPEELVIVDDGSTDGSAFAAREALDVAESSGIDVKLVEQTNAGVSVARNMGANATSARYIAFLDADDEWRPNHLLEIERLANSVPSAGILSTRHARLNQSGQPVPEPSALPLGFFGVVENGLAVYRQGYGVLHTSTIAVSREAWNRSGGFPVGERKSQDIHLWLRLLMSETFAHSDCVTGIWHEEDTGVILRTGAMPAHFSYFLGSDAGRSALANSDLRAFVVSNLRRHIAGHRMRGEHHVVSEMVRLSRCLPFMDRLSIAAVSMTPRPILEAIGRWRKAARSRSLERS